MAVRVRRLFGPTTLTTSSAVLYTVPAGRTAIFRSLTAYNRSGGGATGLVMINGATSADVLWLFTLATQTSTALGVSFILNPGDVLRAHAAVGTAIAMFGFGTLLLGAPE